MNNEKNTTEANQTDAAIDTARLLGVRASAEGSVSIGYSQSDDCICCPGKHVFTYGIDFDNLKNQLGEDADANELVWKLIGGHRHHPEIQGQRVRVTVEFI